jgi:signal transduction histidine kinase
MEVSSVMQLNLINDLMDLAKMKEGKFSLDNEFFDLYITIHNALD